MLILAIETSCDETSAAVVEDGCRIRSNIIASQIDSHKRFGGVVPEIASRHHVEFITVIVEDALAEAGVSYDELDAVAVTYGPGLVGALLIGVHAAKAIALAHNLPLIPVNHMAGHIYSNRFQSNFKFPLLALTVSGGHTELVYMEDHDTYEVIEGRHGMMRQARHMIRLAVCLVCPIREASILMKWPVREKIRLTSRERCCMMRRMTSALVG